MNDLIILERLKNCLNAVKTFITNLVSETAAATVEAIEEIEEAKADKPTFAAVTIPSDGWSDRESTDYPYYYDIAIEGVTADDAADITLAVDSLAVAAECGLCATNETVEGAVRVWAEAVPSAEMSASCRIYKM